MLDCKSENLSSSLSTAYYLYITPPGSDPRSLNFSLGEIVFSHFFGMGGKHGKKKSACGPTKIPPGPPYVSGPLQFLWEVLPPIPGPLRFLRNLRGPGIGGNVRLPEKSLAVSSGVSRIPRKSHGILGDRVSSDFDTFFYVGSPQIPLESEGTAVPSIPGPLRF